MPEPKHKAKVTTKKLAFWESLFQMFDEPTRYLKENETVFIMGTAVVHDPKFGDKEYYKVDHPTYGLGYMRKEGLEVL